MLQYNILGGNMRKLFYFGIYIAACWGIGYSAGYIQTYYFDDTQEIEE